MKKARFGIGLMLGAVVGAITGLLTAPKSGKQTREELKRKSDEAKEMATDRAEEAKERAEDVKERVTRVAKGTREAIDEEVDDFKGKKPTAHSKE